MDLLAPDSSIYPTDKSTISRVGRMYQIEKFVLKYLFTSFSAFCPEQHPYSVNFGRTCCQEKPAR